MLPFSRGSKLYASIEASSLDFQHLGAMFLKVRRHASLPHLLNSSPPQKPCRLKVDMIKGILSAQKVKPSQLPLAWTSLYIGLLFSLGGHCLIGVLQHNVMFQILWLYCVDDEYPTLNPNIPGNSLSRHASCLLCPPSQI